MMQIRDAKYNSDGSIDCEIEHPTLGWIPYTCFEADVIGDADHIYDQLLAGAAGPIAPYIPPVIADKTFAELKLEKLTKIDLLAKEKRDYIVRNYSAAEMASWPIKRDEALKWLSNPNYDIVNQLAPNLNVEAGYRQIAIDSLVTKVMEKAQQFSLLEAALAGYTGYLQDQVKAIPNGDLVAMTAFDTNIGWPI